MQHIQGISRNKLQVSSIEDTLLNKCIFQSREGKQFFKSHFFEVKTNVYTPSFF